VTAQASFNPRNGLVVPAPAPDTPEAVDAVVATAVAAAEPMAAVPPATRAGRLTAIADAVEAMAGAGVTTGPFGIVHGFDAGTRALAAAAPDGWLLTEAIASAYHSGLDRLASAGGRVVAQLPAAPAGWPGTRTVLAVDAAALTSGSPRRDDNPWRVPRRVDGVAA
jgi:hypothetical protein